MKMHSYLRGWGLKANKNVAFLRDTIQKMIDLSYSATRNRCSLQDKTKRPAIQKLAVMWLGIHAFHKVLSQRPQHYRALLQGFSFQLKRPRYQKYRLQFRSLTKDGQEGLLAQIPF
ncbi:hypothetical protein BDZ94DRAFT_1154660 [Collybia nuda]|uniref:Telomerase reverse transcriptase C-terminal extension domain-containing protein n=1 Tax=Collybia nuda TaxID=64659 RepID=A0A9P5YEY8_9AGAR|nr:hypothetical protein BDZ94DRAFT_1154660 [Collybia nuda]